MTSIHRLISFLALLVIWTVGSYALAQQKAINAARPQELISMDLGSSDRAVMASALEEYLNIPVDQRTPGLRAALVDALAIENERRKKYYLGQGPHWALGPDDATGLRLFSEVMRMRDPAYVDVLLPWLCCGNSPAWIDLGKDAVRPVLQFVYANEPGYEESMHGGVSVLQKMVDHWGLDSFSSAEREQLRQIALRYISFNDLPDPWFLLMPAIELASAIEDTELIRMAGAIANDEDELRKRQITSQYRLRDFEQTLSAVISGTREPYRHVPYEQRMMERDALEISD